MKGKKPSLGSALEASKAAEREEAPSAGEGTALAKAPVPPNPRADLDGGYVAPSRKGRRKVQVVLAPEVLMTLKRMALDQGERTLQELMVEAVNDLLVKHGKAPIAS